MSGAGTASNNVALSLSASLAVAGAGSSYTVNVAVVDGQLPDDHQRRRALNLNANFNSPSVVRIQDAGSTLNLNAGTFTAGTLSVLNSATINRTAGTYAVSTLSLANGAGLSHQGSDSISANLSLASGATFTLQKNLALASGSIGLDIATLNLNGRQATVGTFNLSGPAVVNRGAGGGIQGLSFGVTGGTYVIEGSDNFTQSGSVSGGGRLRITWR